MGNVCSCGDKLDSKGEVIMVKYFLNQPNLARVNTSDIMNTNSKNKAQNTTTNKFVLPDVYHIIRIQRIYRKFILLKKQVLPEHVNVLCSYLEN